MGVTGAQRTARFGRLRLTAPGTGRPGHRPLAGAPCACRRTLPEVKTRQFRHRLERGRPCQGSTQERATGIGVIRVTWIGTAADSSASLAARSAAMLAPCLLPSALATGVAMPGRLRRARVRRRRCLRKRSHVRTGPAGTRRKAPPSARNLPRQHRGRRDHAHACDFAYRLGRRH